MPHFFSLRLLNEWQHPEAGLEPLTAALSPTMRDALVCTGSLTRHLEDLLGETIEVRIIDQDHQSRWEHNPTLWGSQHTLDSDRGVTLRSAWLRVGDKKILLAHSQLAIETLSESTRQAIDEGRLPLGSLLLQEENALERQKLELARAVIPDLARQLGEDEDRVFWCRRSLFLVNGAVSARILEIFLTDLYSP